MKNFKWGTTSFDESPIHVVLFVSRNKDNKDIEDFTERRTSFITHESIDSDYLREKFNDFVAKGKEGELSRMYYSVNERDGEKIYKELLHFLFDNPDFNLCSMGSKLAGIAAKKECAKTKKWMFDFDNEDLNIMNEFIKDVQHKLEAPIKLEIHKTPHGYAIITPHGFDCREVLEKYPFVGLKRDDLLCVKWARTGEKYEKI